MSKKQKRNSQDSSSFDPSQLDDPVALKTEWTGEIKRLTNLKTRELVTVNSDRLEIRASQFAKLLCFALLLFGTGTLISFLTFARDEDVFVVVWFLLGAGVMTVGSSIALYVVTIPKVFDKHERLFWKGRKTPDEVFDKNEIKDLVEFDQIHALQIISELYRDSTLYCYQLNLVLKDGKRMNVIDHGNLDELRIEAETLSAFLEKPVWDAIG